MRNLPFNLKDALRVRFNACLEKCIIYTRSFLQDVAEMHEGGKLSFEPIPGCTRSKD